MFWQAETMQLSAANLLVASQQIARAAQPPAPDAQAKFAALLAKEKPAAAAATFEPLEFALAAPPATRQAPPANEAPAGGSGARGPLGANVDIRV